MSSSGGRGRALAAAPTVLQTIRQAGYEPVDISGDSAAASVSAVRAAVAAGAKRVIAVGGDGTVHLALQGVTNTDVVLGIVPVGTGNDFAGALGLNDMGVEQASLRALGSHRVVDAIRVNNSRWVAFNITGGFSVAVNDRAARLRYPRGPGRYTVATLLSVPRLRHHRLAITVDGQHRKYNSALFAVANTATFGGGMAICPQADPADGLLDVCVVGSVGRTTLLRLLPKVFNGGHVDHPEVEMLRGRSITLEGEPLKLVGDGEEIGTTPITLEATPAALRVAADP